jgi:hypothetical protein
MDRIHHGPEGSDQITRSWLEVRLMNSYVSTGGRLWRLSEAGAGRRKEEIDGHAAGSLVFSTGPGQSTSDPDRIDFQGRSVTMYREF